jgi:oligoendopeptidase F|tara:strand:- start:72 stop:437 length:366 start_codon:yes stop_codon:yes gene_type:complete
MTEDFFKSEIVQEELNDLQTSYTELLKMSQEFGEFDDDAKINHINKTLELIAKQKVFYSRLEMMANYVEEDGDEQTEVQEMKERIDTVSNLYTNGESNLLQILQVMEDKLLGWKKQLQEGG